MKFSVFQISRKGGREKNEDRMGYCYTREACLFVLADGMGGHPQGEVAAQIAIQSVSAEFQRRARPTLPDIQEFLTSSLLAAHQPFESVEKLLDGGRGPYSQTQILETNTTRIRVRDTDLGKNIQSQINDLRSLLDAYRSGLIKER